MPIVQAPSTYTRRLNRDRGIRQAAYDTNPTWGFSRYTAPSPLAIDPLLQSSATPIRPAFPGSMASMLYYSQSQTTVANPLETASPQVARSPAAHRVPLNMHHTPSQPTTNEYQYLMEIPNNLSTYPSQDGATVTNKSPTPLTSGCGAAATCGTSVEVTALSPLTQVLQLPDSDVAQESQQPQPQAETRSPEVHCDILTHAEPEATAELAEDVPQLVTKSSQGSDETQSGCTEAGLNALFDEDFLLGIDPLAWGGFLDTGEEDQRFVDL
ncbi:hypothetical protein LIA77_00889 [Sarocladium implicatum]|nr:hypothetical protein LIA77_00889 [Sarocladium implicatum]